MRHSVEFDLRDLEHELCRLPDVSAARIVADAEGRPIEIHILALPTKPAKQIVRDIQSVAFAEFGLDLDRRIVSVVQFGGGVRHDEVAGVARYDFRPTIAGITAEAHGMRSVVRVSLESNSEVATGFAEGSIAMSARARLAATATVDALRQLEPAAEHIDIESARILRVGEHDVALVNVVIVTPPTEELISGTAIVRNYQENEAIARAVLDATNRRLPQLV
jgi:hypothetical protein